MKAKKILLSHGSGGELMHQLINELLIKKLNNPVLRQLEDSALINYKERVAFTTDSFVVNPIFFFGGDIGKLAVCGTVNDLVVMGAKPEYLSLALILEEGFGLKALEKIIDSVSVNARKIGVNIVTGDTKVVEKGAADKIFINTAGLGRLITKKRLSLNNIQPKDKIIVTGEIGQHGLAVLTKRKDLDLGFNIKSDCASLDSLIVPLLKKTDSVIFMRDPTRGGVATTLNEIAMGANLGISIEEKDIPVSKKLRAACELLGMDPLYSACEGRAIIVVRQGGAKRVLDLLRKNPLGKKSKIIGTVTERPKGSVVLNTSIGSQRILDMLSGEVLPRIC